MSDPYEDDFAGWAKSQAEIIRGIRDVPGLDAARLADEVESLGRREIIEIRQHLRRAFVDLIALAFDDDPFSDASRLVEIDTHLELARDFYSPAYLGRIDLEAVWRKASKTAGPLLPTNDGPYRIPQYCPFSIDWLMSDETFDAHEALHRVQGTGRRAFEG